MWRTRMTVIDSIEPNFQPLKAQMGSMPADKLGPYGFDSGKWFEYVACCLADKA